MANFIKDSIDELDHVVWPTHTETSKYMTYTVGTIIIVATLLAIAGYFLSASLSGVRSQFDHNRVITTNSNENDLVTEADLEKLKKAAEAKNNLLSGATINLDSTGASVQVMPAETSGTGN